MDQHQRNTPEAPALERCEVCGATRLDGNGQIVDLNGNPNCERCKGGAEDLVREDPTNYEFGPDGRLRYIGPPREDLARQEAEVRQLANNLAIMLPSPTIYMIEAFHPRSGVAIILPNKYRLHVYIPDMDPEGQGHYSVRLFTPERTMLPGLPVLRLDILGDAVELAKDSTQPGTELHQFIAEDQAARQAINAFNPDDLLNES